MHIFLYILGSLLALGVLVFTMGTDISIRFITPENPEYPEKVETRTLFGYVIGIILCIISLIIGLIIRL